MLRHIIIHGYKIRSFNPIDLSVANKVSSYICFSGLLLAQGHLLHKLFEQFPLWCTILGSYSVLIGKLVYKVIEVAVAYALRVRIERIHKSLLLLRKLNRIGLTCQASACRIRGFCLRRSRLSCRLRACGSGLGHKFRCGLICPLKRHFPVKSFISFCRSFTEALHTTFDPLAPGVVGTVRVCNLIIEITHRLVVPIRYAIICRWLGFAGLCFGYSRFELGYLYRRRSTPGYIGCGRSLRNKLRTIMRTSSVGFLKIDARREKSRDFSLMVRQRSLFRKDTRSSGERSLVVVECNTNAVFRLLSYLTHRDNPVFSIGVDGITHVKAFVEVFVFLILRFEILLAFR